MILPCNVFQLSTKTSPFSFNNKIVNDITHREREIHFYGTTFHYYIPPPPPLNGRTTLHTRKHSIRTYMIIRK